MNLTRLDRQRLTQIKYTRPFNTHHCAVIKTRPMRRVVMKLEFISKPLLFLKRVSVPLLGIAGLIGLSTVNLPSVATAAPINLGVSSVNTTLSSNMLGDLTLVHCCHNHPLPPYDAYCCHSAGAYVVGGAVAYGAYRGVRRATVHHHRKHHNRPRPTPRRRR